MTDTGNTNNWLVRSTTIRLLWRIFAAVLAFLVFAQIFIKVKSYFGIDGWFGFATVFGFLACVVMVFLAKGLGVFLKRDESYYDEGDSDA